MGNSNHRSENSENKASNVQTNKDFGTDWTKSDDISEKYDFVHEVGQESTAQKLTGIVHDARSDSLFDPNIKQLAFVDKVDTVQVENLIPDWQDLSVRQKANEIVDAPFSDSQLHSNSDVTAYDKITNINLCLNSEHTAIHNEVAKDFTSCESSNHSVLFDQDTPINTKYDFCLTVPTKFSSNTVDCMRKETIAIRREDAYGDETLQLASQDNVNIAAKSAVGNSTDATGDTWCDTSVASVVRPKEYALKPQRPFLGKPRTLSPENTTMERPYDSLSTDYKANVSELLSYSPGMSDHNDYIGEGDVNEGSDLMVDLDPGMKWGSQNMDLHLHESSVYDVHPDLLLGAKTDDNNFLSRDNKNEDFYLQALVKKDTGLHKHGNQNVTDHIDLAKFGEAVTDFQERAPQTDKQVPKFQHGTNEMDYDLNLQKITGIFSNSESCTNRVDSDLDLQSHEQTDSNLNSNTNRIGADLELQALDEVAPDLDLFMNPTSSVFSSQSAEETDSYIESCISRMSSDSCLHSPDEIVPDVEPCMNQASHDLHFLSGDETVSVAAHVKTQTDSDLYLHTLDEIFPDADQSMSQACGDLHTLEEIVPDYPEPCITHVDSTDLQQGEELVQCLDLRMHQTDGDLDLQSQGETVSDLDQYLNQTGSYLDLQPSLHKIASDVEPCMKQTNSGLDAHHQDEEVPDLDIDLGNNLDAQLLGQEFPDVGTRMNPDESEKLCDTKQPMNGAHSNIDVELHNGIDLNPLMTLPYCEVNSQLHKKISSHSKAHITQTERDRLAGYFTDDGVVHKSIIIENTIWKARVKQYLSNRMSNTQQEVENVEIKYCKTDSPLSVSCIYSPMPLTVEVHGLAPDVTEKYFLTKTEGTARMTNDCENTDNSEVNSVASGANSSQFHKLNSSDFNAVSVSVKKGISEIPHRQTDNQDALSKPRKTKTTNLLAERSPKVATGLKKKVVKQNANSLEGEAKLNDEHIEKQSKVKQFSSALPHTESQVTKPKTKRNDKNSTVTEVNPRASTAEINKALSKKQKKNNINIGGAQSERLGKSDTNPLRKGLQSAQEVNDRRSSGLSKGQAKKAADERLQLLLSGYEKLQKDAFVVIAWSVMDLDMTSKEEIQTYLNILSVTHQFELEFSVEDVKIKQSSTSKMAAVVKLKNRKHAKEYVRCLNARSAETGVTAGIRALPSSHIETLRKAHWQSIQLKMDQPLLQHNIRRDVLVTQLEKLSDDRRSKNFFALGDLMDEIHAVENKLKELDKQGIVFEKFTVALKEKYDNLKFETSNIEMQAEDLLSSFNREIARINTALPMYANKQKIVSFVEQNQVCIIIGETGSGKSTQLAQYLHEENMLKTPAIACTQPRKVAATSLAKRVAFEMGSTVGQIVGYNVGMNQHTSQNTQIQYMTDHVMLRECLKDPDLSKYGCIIVDEAHERSIYTDLLLAMIKKLLPRRRDLKVIITSATINPDVFVHYFGGCPVMRVSGRAFPVEVHYDVTDHVDDYFFYAVQKAKEVHITLPPGDILVFLTSPLETEKACEQLTAKIGVSNAIVLPLHGQLQSTEQNKVFEETPRGMRKIVFATNCAETSITINGIKYVIDSGFVKERIYDTKRSVNALKLVRITNSSAEQRKGRAGRTQSGTCFRLYTEDTYDTFRPNTTPEIMTMHLGLAFLQLMSLNVRDPLSFDFVESPPRESLEKAAKLLEDLGAAKNGEITEFGQKLAKLSLEPRLGKFVLDGIDAGLDQEVVTIGAIFSTGASLFFRAGSDEEKDKADRLKTMFCQKEGDLITLLSVYKSWCGIDDRRKNAWCFTNSLNAKSARIVRDCGKEITHTLKRELKINVKPDFIEDQVVKSQISRLLLRCFPANIGRYLGCPNGGYILPFDDMKKADIHPSSSLKYLDHMPDWVLFETVLTTSRDFLINLTFVESDFVYEAVNEGVLDVDFDELNKRLVQPFTLDTYFGNMVMKNFIGPKFAYFKELEGRITTEIKDFAFLDRTNNYVVTCYAPLAHHGIAKTMLQTHVDKLKSELEKETLEISVEENSGARILLQQGCTIGQFLLPSEFLSILIAEAPHWWNSEDARAAFDSYGTVVECLKFTALSKRGKQNTSWGKVTFNDMESASNALNIQLEDDEQITVKPCCRNNQNPASSMPFCFETKWCRREKRGFAFIQIRRDDEFVLCKTQMDLLYVGRLKTKVYEGRRPNQLYAPKLEANITEADIVKDITRCLGMQIDLTEKDVYFPRVAEYPPSNEGVEYASYLENICTDLGIPSNHFKVNVRPPKSKDFYMKAFVQLANPNIVTRLRLILSRSLYRSRAQKVELNLRTSFTFLPEVYEVLKDDIEAAIGILQKDSPHSDGDSSNNDSSNDDNDRVNDKIEVKLRQLNNRMYTMNITTEDSETLQTCRDFISPILKSHEEELSRKFVTYLSTQTGRTFLKGVDKKYGVYTITERRSNTLHIYGNATAKESSWRKVQEHLDEISQLHIADISLQGMPGIIKELFKKYGFMLQHLTTKVHASQLELILQKRVIHFQGTEDSLKSLNDEIANLQKEHPAAHTECVDLPDCPICFSPIEESNKHVLEVCGHMYCTECLGGLVANAIQEKKFPLTCATENCEIGISIADIKTIKGSTPRELRDLIKAGIEHLVVQSSGVYKHCITPNCDAVYRTTKLSNEPQLTAYRCYQCEILLCTTCHGQYHTGVSCHVNKGLKEDSDYGLKLYMRRHKRRVAMCKRCGRHIEKIEGCNHMMCPCGAHFCWVCHEVFDTGDETYDHQRRCRGEPIDY